MKLKLFTRRKGVSTVSIKTKQETEAAQSRPREDRWKWVEQTIWTEKMLMALENGVKGNKWFSLIDKVYKDGTLEKAWENVRRNKGSAGIDKITIERFAKSKDKYIKEMVEDLIEGKYKSSLIKRVNIPKEGGKSRPLGIPTIKDRIVQSAVKMVIEPIWESKFYSSSYGFRPEKNAHDAITEVSQYIKDGYTWVIDADIKGYFEFLGYRFERGNKFVRKVSQMRLKDKIRTLTKRTCGKNVGKVIYELNKVLVGWFNYFKMAQGKIYCETDAFIRRRLRAILRKQKKRPGMGKTLSDHKQWPNEYFAKLGLFSLETARAIY